MHEATSQVLREALWYAKATRWDSLRSPHVFMGLLASPDGGIESWADHLGADLPRLLEQFRDLFHLHDGNADSIIHLNREFLSDNVIRLLRSAYYRALDQQRTLVMPLDILISMFAAPHSIVAECFARVGVPTNRLMESAVRAEQSAFFR